jgi:hypothetical protein
MAFVTNNNSRAGPLGELNVVLASFTARYDRLQKEITETCAKRAKFDVVRGRLRDVRATPLRQPTSGRPAPPSLPTPPCPGVRQGPGARERG